MTPTGDEPSSVDAARELEPEINEAEETENIVKVMRMNKKDRQAHEAKKLKTLQMEQAATKERAATARYQADFP